MDIPAAIRKHCMRSIVCDMFNIVVEMYELEKAETFSQAVFNNIHVSIKTHIKDYFDVIYFDRVYTDSELEESWLLTQA